VPWQMKFSMLCLAIMCIAGGVMLLPFFKPFLTDAVNVLVEGTRYAETVMREAVR